MGMENCGHIPCHASLYFGQSLGLTIHLQSDIMYIMQNVSVANARQHLSEILGKVAYGGEAFVITKKGRPMARLMPIVQAKSKTKKPKSLGDIEGWLADNDPFFQSA